MLIKLGVILWLGYCAHAQRSCSRDRMRQCEDSLLRNIQRRSNDMSRTEMASHCQTVRADFNCLLQETRCLSGEGERNRNGDTMRNAIKYIRDGCDTAGSTWRENSCFVGDGMKNCESSYPLGGVQYASYNPETCRKYNLFYDCAMDVIRNRCRPEDEKLMGQYLVDSAQDLAWNCGESTSSSSNSDWNRDRDRDDRRLGSSSSDRYSDRERDFNNRDRGYNSRDQDRTYDRDRGQYNPSNRNDYNSDVTCCRSERCDRSRMQQCRDSLSRAIDTRTSGYQDSNKCRRTRDDFNCLMWQTSNCMSREERDRDNDIFRRARDFISRNCDSYGRWSENNCFRTDGMQRCEALLSNTRGGANYEACRNFLTFRDCMSDELNRRCTREDELYQGAYMVDKAQEMSWQCGQDRNGGGSSYQGNNGYSNFDRRDRYDRPDRPDYGGYESNSPAHLEDEDAMCYSRVQTYAEQCKEQLNDRKRNLFNENDYYNRQKITCCSAKELRSCLYEVTRRYCQQERARVVDNFMAGQRHILQQDSCLRIYDSECSAAARSQLSIALLAVCVVLLSAIFAFRH